MANVVWPVCCERLTTLVMDQGGGMALEQLEAAAGPLDDALTDAARGYHQDGPKAARVDWAKALDGVRSGRHGGDGLVVFHCRVCGRLYGSWCEP
jgi:hypothetical protein